MFIIAKIADKKESIQAAAVSVHAYGGKRNVWLEEGSLLLSVDSVDFPDPKKLYDDPKSIRLEIWRRDERGAPARSVTVTFEMGWDDNSVHVGETVWEQFCQLMADSFIKTLLPWMGEPLSIRSVKNYITQFIQIGLLDKNEMVITDKGFDLNFEKDGKICYFHSSYVKAVRSVGVNTKEGNVTLHTAAPSSVVTHQMVGAVRNLVKYKFMHSAETLRVGIVF